MRKKLSILEKEEPGLRLSDEAISNLLAKNTRCITEICKDVLSIVIGEELSKPVRTGIYPLSRYEVERKLRLADIDSVSNVSNGNNDWSFLIVETETINEELTQGEY